MSGTALPLPLALSKPVPLASDPEAVLAAGLGMYNPETQMGAYRLDGFNVQITFNNSQSYVGSDNGNVFQIDDWFQVDDLN